MTPRRCALLLTLFLTLALFSADALKTGTALTKLPSPLYLDGSSRTLREFLGSKPLVLLLWEPVPASVNEFAAISDLAARFRDQVGFLGIGIGEPDDLKRFPGALRLGFPVNVDAKGEALRLLRRDGERTPLAVLLDKDGVILWRGRPRQLPVIIRDLTAGKFDLAEQIRLENFTADVNRAVREKKWDLALDLLTAERKRYPKKLDLLSAQLSLLRKLGRRADALRILHDTQAQFPGNHRLYEMEYQSISDGGDPGELPDFFRRVKRDFAKSPGVLIAFAIAELQLPPDKLDLACVVDLAAAGWAGQHFPDRVTRGLYAMEYARIMHTLGRNDLASRLAAEACSDLEAQPAQREKARRAHAYYTKMDAISASLALPDLTSH